MALKIQDIIDIEQFQLLQDRLNEIYSFPSAIIDNDGKILTATAWQDVCTKFHRQNSECEKECIKSDQYIADHLHEANPAISYRCPHGLIDNATPIIIEGVHYGNYFTGQFFLEPPDLNFFRDRAKRYGFDEEAYIDAVKKVPIWTKKQLDSYLFFIKGLIEVIASTGLKNLKEIEAAKKIKASEERHRTILKTAMDGIWLVDMQGHLLEVNETYCRMSGYSEQELLAMRISDLEIAESDDDAAAHIQKIMAQGDDLFESRHRCKDGRIFDVEVSVQYKPTDGGWFVSFIRDITKRKRAEEEIHLNESRLRRLVDILQHPSDTIQDFLDYALDQAIQLTGSKIGYIYHYHEDRKEFVLNTWSKEVMAECIVANPSNCYELNKTGIWGEAVRQRRPMIVNDFQAVHPLKKGYPDGHVQLLKFMTVPIFKDGRIVGVIGLANKETDYEEADILQASLLMEAVWKVIETKQAAEALRESNELLSLYMRYSPIYTYIKEVTPTQSLVLRASDNFQELIGIPGCEVVGKTMEELFQPEFAAKITADDWAVVSRGDILSLEEELNGRSYTTIKFPIIRGDKTLLAGYTIDITDHKRAEEEQQKTQRLLTISQRLAHIGSWETELSTGKLSWSDEMYRILGFPDSAPVYLDMALSVFPPDELLRFREAIASAIRGDAPYNNIDYTIIRHDGQARIIHEEGEVIFNENGIAVQMFGTTQDITERKQAEVALSNERNLIANIMETSPVGITTVDAKGKVTFANSKAIAILGLSKDEISQTTYNAPTWHISDLDGKPFPDNQLPFNIVVSTGKSVFDVQHAIQWPDGKRILLSINGVPMIDANGHVNGMVASIEDITQRKTVEEKLVAGHKLLSNLASLVPGVIYQYRLYPDGRSAFPYASQAMNDIYEVTPEEVREDATPVFGRLHPDDHDRVAADIFESARTLETFYCEFRVILPRQGLRWRWSQAQPQRLDDGSTLWHGIISDITERKQAEVEKIKLEAQLFQSQKMESVGRLAGGVAHDFNNMLGLIIGYVEMAMDKVEVGHPLLNDLLEIKNAAQRSADLTRQLLAFARKQVVSPKVLDLNDTMAGMLNMLQRLIGENINLAWLPGANLWPVKIDPSQIDQILANLCVNARDAITGVGKITIETKNIILDEVYCADHAGFVPGEYVLLTMSDNGCGMDKEIIGKLFEPFFTTKGVGKGTGLGLATIYGIVKQNNGFINVYSEPDHGTTFRIYLPRHIGKAEQAQTEVRQEQVIRGHETVLVVEDEPSLLELSKLMLETQGYRVLTADTPGEAIRLAEKHAGEIHLLMTDVVLPEMNGPDLAQKLLSVYPNLKCLFTSGYTANVITHHGVLDEGVYFIQKPFSRKDLAAKVRETLNHELDLDKK